MDYELFLAMGFVLLALLGLVYEGLGGMFIFVGNAPMTPPASQLLWWTFAVQYGLVFTIVVLGRYALLPTILLFLTIIALITVIRLGLQAHSKPISGEFRIFKSNNSG